MTKMETKKLMKKVSKLDIIRAMCYIGNIDGIGVVQVCYSDNNEMQLDSIARMFVPAKGATNVRIESHDGDVFPYPGGYYVFSYGDKLEDYSYGFNLEYSIKVTYNVGRLCKYDEGDMDVYLYYIGQNND